MARLVTEIIYHVAASLDGFIATADGGVAWLSPFENAGTDHGYADFFASLDGLIFGRRTYEQALTFGAWPYAGKPCWVFSRKPLSSTLPEMIVTADALQTVVAAIESRGLRRIWLVGGGELAGSFCAADLITEYRIAIVPIFLGAGIPILGGHAPRKSLHLVETKTYPTGIVLLTYRKSEPVEAGKQEEA
jgi:dihydrofolate reductase